MYYDCDTVAKRNSRIINEQTPDCNLKGGLTSSTVPISLPHAVITARLAGGSTPYSGRLEVLVNGRWGTVCDSTGSTFNKTDADVACRQLLGQGQAINQGLYSLFS